LKWNPALDTLHPIGRTLVGPYRFGRGFDAGHLVILLETGQAKWAIKSVFLLDVVGRFIDDHFTLDRTSGMELGDQLILPAAGLLSFIEQVLQSGRILRGLDSASSHGIREFLPETKGIFRDLEPLRDSLAKSHKVASWQPHPHFRRSFASTSSINLFIGRICLGLHRTAVSLAR
jgi:hypothetical protein